MSHNPTSAVEADGLPSRRWLRRDRPILAYMLLLFMAVVLVLNYFIKLPTLPEEAVVSFRAYRANRLPLHFETSDSMKLSRYFAVGGTPFAVRNLDPATYTLKGGRVHKALNRRSYWYAYERQDKKVFVFQEYARGAWECAAPVEIGRNQGLNLHIDAREEVVAVFWQEKSHCCSLTSDGNREEVVQLAKSSVSVKVD